MHRRTPASPTPTFQRSWHPAGREAAGRERIRLCRKQRSHPDEARHRVLPPILRRGGLRPHNRCDLGLSRPARSQGQLQGDGTGQQGRPGRQVRTPHPRHVLLPPRARCGSSGHAVRRRRLRSRSAVVGCGRQLSETRRPARAQYDEAPSAFPLLGGLLPQRCLDPAGGRLLLTRRSPQPRQCPGSRELMPSGERMASAFGIASPASTHFGGSSTAALYALDPMRSSALTAQPSVYAMGCERQISFGLQTRRQDSTGCLGEPEFFSNDELRQRCQPCQSAFQRDKARNSRICR